MASDGVMSAISVLEVQFDNNVQFFCLKAARFTLEEKERR